MLSHHLAQISTAYGDLPAHDGRLQTGGAIKNDLLARLAIALLVRETRGLDGTPAMTENLKIRRSK